jgi:hypothetical protein
VTDELLIELIREVRGLRRDLRGRRSDADDLVVALDKVYGDGVFTVAGIMAEVDDDPHGRLADAVALVVDMNATPQSRATRLGQVLAGLDLELVGDRRGAAAYRVRT